MAIDTDRLVQIANELKSLDQRRQKLLAELQRVAGDIGGGAPAARRRGRPPGPRNQASAQETAAVVRRGPGRPPRSPVPAVAPRRAELMVSRRGGRRKKGLTKAIVDLLQGNGAAYTAGDIVRELKLPETKSQISTVSTTLGRLVKQGQVKKDEERGYIAA